MWNCNARASQRPATAFVERRTYIERTEQLRIVRDMARGVDQVEPIEPGREAVREEIANLFRRELCDLLRVLRSVILHVEDNGNGLAPDLVFLRVTAPSIRADSADAALTWRRISSSVKMSFAWWYGENFSGSS